MKEIKLIKMLVGDKMFYELFDLYKAADLVPVLLEFDMDGEQIQIEMYIPVQDSEKVATILSGKEVA